MSRATVSAPPKPPATRRKPRRSRPRLHRRHWLIRAFAALWGFIWWLWSSIIFGGLIVGAGIAYATSGTTGLKDPTTWPVVQPLLANPLPTALGAALAILLTILAYLAHRYQSTGPEDAQRAEYILKRVDRVDPEALMIPEYVANVYLPRREDDGTDADAKATNALRLASVRRDPFSLIVGPLGICVYGQTMEGKTRLAYECTVQTLPGWTFVRWQGKPDVPLNYEKLRGQNVVLWLDDLQKLGPNESTTVVDLPRRFAEARIPLVVVATCRGGEDEKGVRERLGGLLDRLTAIRPANISRAEANTLERELAQEGHAVLSNEFDGTPGSLLLGVQRMRDEVYPKLSPEAKHLLWALKLLRSARIYTYPAPRVRRVAIGVFALPEGRWRDARDELVAAKFLRLGAADRDGEYPLEVVADPYLDKAVPGYPPNAPGASEADDWVRLQQVLSNPVDADALIYLGNAYNQRPLGNLRQNRQRAEACYRAALTVSTREAAPADWATTQNNLGEAFRNQASLAEGDARATLLAEAVAAYRAALTVFTREAAPADWAMTQNNLGLALTDQASLAERDTRAALLADAVAAYRAALIVYTQETDPAHWAGTQNNLGTALWRQASLAEGDERARLLGEAVAAFRTAQAVYTREAAPAAWAGTQNNLAVALWQQASLAEGDARATLLAEAVAAYRAALTVFTREAAPADWAMTQNNLGLALWQQGEVAEKSERASTFSEAMDALRAALTVHTRETMPADWAATHLSLAILRYSLAEEEGNAGNMDGACSMLTEALQELDLAQQVFTVEHMPMQHAAAEDIREVITEMQQEFGCQ